jgi:hypothetical protein
VRDCQRTWLLCIAPLIAGCGRLGFEALPGTIDAPDDAGTDGEAACILGPFGAPELVVELNSAMDDWTVTLSADENEAVLASWRAGGQRIFAATRTGPGMPFGSPVLVSQVDSGTSDSTPMLSFDGLTLMLSSTRPGGLGSADLWSFTRPDRGSAFGSPLHLVELSSSRFESKPWLSPDGLRVYLSSDRGTDRDLYIAERASPSGMFGTPVLIPELSSPGLDGGPTLSADELELFFTSDRSGGVGLHDVWVARRASRMQPFGPPENVTAVNTTFDDLSHWLSANGRAFYHARDTLVGGGRDANIWVTRRACLP